MQQNPKWLDVQWENRPQSMNTINSCITLCDLKSDNYMRLVVTDIPLEANKLPKLKVFKGITMDEELVLPGIPSAVESLYIAESEPKTPIIAVAIAESVLFYRRMKPYFKFTIPELHVEEMEKEFWNKLSVERAEKQDILVDSFKSSIDRQRLTRKSQKLLQLPLAERSAFVKVHEDSPLQRFSTIVAMKCLPRVSSDNHPHSCLVLAADNGDIFILDPQTFCLLYQAKTCSYETSPSLIAIQGQYETDFRIIIATRYGAIYLLCKTWFEGKEIFKMNHPLVGLLLLPIDKTILVAGRDNQLACYSKKGKQLHTTRLSSTPVCLIPICLDHLGMTLACVALEGGQVLLYSQKHIVDEFRMETTITAMIFGPLGREEYVLTLFSDRGEMFVKILRRIATFDVTEGDLLRPISDGSANEMDILDRVKKSSIFIEQSAREKENAKATYGSFQVDLWRLRHAAARATVDAITSAQSTISEDSVLAPIKISAEICGSGPSFRLFLNIQNMSSHKMATNLSILLHANRMHYTIPKSVTKLPIILPGKPLKIDFEIIANLDPNDGLPPPTLTPDNAIIRIMVLKAAQSKPLIAAVIAMPESEANLEN